jgi:hypothetical protein
MVEERLTYRVELDTGQLQSDLSMIQSGVGTGLQNLFAAPGQAMGTMGAAFNTVNADIMSVRQTTAMMAAPLMPPSPIPFGTGPDAALIGAGGQFIDPAAQAGGMAALGAWAGITPPPRNVLMADLMNVQGQGIAAGLSRAGRGLVQNFGIPMLGAGLGAAVGSLVPIPGATIAGGILGGAAGEVLGPGMFERGENIRQREMIFRASGMQERGAEALAQEMAGLRADPLMANFAEDEITDFATQQAFAGRMRPGSEPENIKKNLEKFKKDLRSVAEIQATLNLAFDEAAELMGAFQAAGLESGPRAGEGAAGGGTVMRVLGQARSMGQFGFTPAQQRQAVMEAVGAGQQALMSGQSAQPFLRTVGQADIAAGQLFRLAQESDDPLLTGVRRLGTASNVEAAVERGQRAVFRAPIVQAAVQAALLGTEDPEEALRIAGEIGPDPRAIDAHTDKILDEARARKFQEMIDSGATPREARATADMEVTAMITRSRAQVGSTLELAARDPEKGGALVGGFMGFLEQDLEGFRGLDDTKKADTLAAILGASIADTRAMMAAHTSLTDEHFKKRQEMLDKAVAQIQDNTSKIESALTTQIKAAIAGWVGALADTDIVKKSVSGLARTITGAGRGLPGGKKQRALEEYSDLARESLMEEGVDVSGMSEADALATVEKRAIEMESIAWEHPDWTPVELKAPFAAGKRDYEEAQGKKKAREQLAEEAMTGKLLADWQERSAGVGGIADREEAARWALMKNPADAAKIGAQLGVEADPTKMSMNELKAVVRQLIALQTEAAQRKLNTGGDWNYDFKPWEQ